MSSFWDFFSQSDSNEKNERAGYRGSPWKADDSPNSDFHYWQGVNRRQAEIEREREAERRRAERERQWEEEQRQRRNSSW